MACMILITQLVSMTMKMSDEKTGVEAMTDADMTVEKKEEEEEQTKKQ